MGVIQTVSTGNIGFQQGCKAPAPLAYRDDVLNGMTAYPYNSREDFLPKIKTLPNSCAFSSRDIFKFKGRHRIFASTQDIQCIDGVARILVFYQDV